ncbi:cytochrome b [Chromatiaceae bacterium AAb-1]|nr:cytochrome b [Chromatiaceae bacterium AAb-1]
MFKNRSTHYGLVSVTLHWLVALTVFGLFALGFWMVDLTYYSSWYRTAPHWHKSVGIILLIAMLFRVGWRFFTVSPLPVATHRKWEQIASKAAHFLLYAGIFAIIFTGYLISTADGRPIAVFDWFEIPSAGELFARQADIAGDLHRYLAYGVIAIAVLHAVAALKHHFIDKDATFRRMLGRKN